MSTVQLLQILNIAGILAAVLALATISFTFYTVMQFSPKALKCRILELSPAPPGKEKKLPSMKRTVEISVPAETSERLKAFFENDVLQEGWQRTG